ncbi:ATP-binding cassette domain-containing protein [Streptococcus sciuri]|uniref:ABC transporter ATP-binding protein/permease n=1 Tax=Streptococcus sciuri TaxID=2973939 RepID=A0ABT2F6J8_9STRE|nr:ABC transporter ATP-binding protein [Streptococcus sciuri]MCS4488054.1 ABC transporter ATP-binding protein/permease [Streptococcus sciuri]
MMFLYIRKRYKENVFLFIIIAISTFLKIESAFLTADAFNGLIAGDTEVFVRGAILAALLYFVYVILLAFRTWYEVFVRQKMLADIRNDIVSSYVKTNPNKDSESNIISWLTMDINRIDNEGYGSFYKITEAIVEVTLSIFALIYINWLLMLSIVLLAVLNLILPKLLDKQMAESFGQLTSKQEKFTIAINNIAGGFKHLFSLNQQKYFSLKAGEEIESIREVETSTYKIVGAVTFLAAFGNVLGQIGSFILSGFFVVNKLISFGQVISVSTISVDIFNGVSNLSSSIIEMMGIFPIFEKFQSLQKGIQEESLKDDSKIQNFEFTDAVTLKDLTLSLEGNEIFSCANFTFQKGKKYCLVGASGTGKSTLLKILNGGMSYDRGTVAFDDTLIADISGSSLRSQITYVEQYPYVFDGTVRENILLKNKNLEGKIEEILTSVGLLEEVKKLPKGLDTVIGSEGVSLSGGQQQRLSLARALINGGNFLLLDESTSSLNRELARMIEKNLLSNHQYTIIAITHHLSSEMKPYFDEIIELKEGKIVIQNSEK